MLNQTMVETCFLHFPNKACLVHENRNCVGKFWENTGNKMTLFKIGDFSDIYYHPGAHTVDLKLYQGKTIKSLNNLDICSFHLKNIDIDYCTMKKNRSKDRLSEENIRANWGHHYKITDENYRKEYENKITTGFPISNYIDNTINR